MKKIGELSTTYSSGEVEKKWYGKWDEGKYFKPKDRGQNKTYTITMPPPNVTGKLHAGHALDVVTQDALIRFKRMKGFETLWVPGMDHAGIATQSVVEKSLKEKEGKSRQEYSRKEFLDKIWKWKEEYGGIIAKQQRSLGASPDWDYSMFTMDEIPHQAVNKVFVKLYNEGLIYQSDYIINWDPELQSAISDAEVEHKEVNGAFYHITYQVKDSDEVLEIATTRPETLLGDTAVSVHPEDERFKHLIGKTAIVPICNREVPILGDDYVDMEKGTGCLKVTPGHDFNDFDIGKRHGLPIINILNKNGTLNSNAGEFEGLTCKKARKEIVIKLKELERFVKTENHVHQVGHGDRSKVIIEPMVSKQWFLNTKAMAEDAVTAIENGTTKFYPKGWENTYFAWLREPKNWCISRQLWWGHQIPVYTCEKCGHQVALEETPSTCDKCEHTTLIQDPDVLDTWFSSGLWPMSTLGWPNKEAMEERGFDRFFPTSTLVTGFDIIFFWVARMMMMSLKSVNKVPFEKIYIHAIVRDKLGRKMSKSLNNGIDPIEMIQEYGADALRFSLAAGSGYNRGLNLDPERIAGYRNFINKIWNAFRFTAPFINESEAELPKELDHAEKWILSELNNVTKVMNESIEEFRYDESCMAIYSFVYDKFCSWFIELSKSILHGDNEEKKRNRASVLRFVFRKIVALLHPFTPYITEELWGYLKNENEDLLIIQPYPEHQEAFIFEKDSNLMNKFIEVVTCVRNLRASVNMKPKEEVTVKLFTDDSNLCEYYHLQLTSFMELARIKEITVEKRSSEKPKKSVMSATSHTEVFLPLEGVIDLNEQVKRLEKQLTKAQKEFDKLSKKSKNEKFMKNAPPEVVEEVKTKAIEFETQIQSITENLENFK